MPEDRELRYYAPINVDLAIKVPSFNDAWKPNPHGGMYKTAEAKAFQEAVAWSYRGDFHEGDVEVFIEFHRSPIIDADNAIKLVLDALEGKAYKNDRQVCSVTCDRYKGEDHLYVTVQAR